MKKLLLISLILLSLSSKAQYKVSYEKDKTGWMITASGIVLSTIALTIKDGGEFTYSNGYNSTSIIKPFWQCTNRVVMLGISVSVSIGGIIYQRNSK